MFQCKKCNKIFENITKLAGHLSHPKSTCKCNVKDYYDQFIRKQHEGICIYCGNETAFGGIGKGYPNNKCKHCRNKGKETQRLRKESYKKKSEIKKIESGYYILKEICELCGDRFSSKHGLSKHIATKHLNTNIKEYYDKYLKIENEGVCPITKKETRFKSLVYGYYNFFGKGTCSCDNEVKERKKETLLKNYGVDNAAKANEEYRIINYKKAVSKRNELKQKRLKLINLLRKLTIDKTNKLQCQICGLIFNSIRCIVTHIHKGHKVQAETYYAIFFKKENEGICPASNKKTTFLGLNLGYLKYKENYHKSQVLTDKVRATWAEKTRKKSIKKCYKYNVKIIDITEIQNISSKIKLRCLKCNNIYENRIYNLQLGYGKCPLCFPRNVHKSKGESELFSFLKNSLPNLSIYQSYRNFKDSNGKLLELDIYIPKKNIAIEFNGLYWHSENILEDPVNYHLNKTKMCESNNVRLIHIFEDEWYDKKDICKKMLLHKLSESKSEKIYARKCYIKEISPKEKNNFLKNNHIQGEDSAKIKLGLFTKDMNKLVAVMTFSGKNLSRGTININENTWELSRFATDLNYVVVGAASKLLKYFTTHYKWFSIFSYADLRLSTGDLYRKLGFVEEQQTLPAYWYIGNQCTRIHRFRLRKTVDEPRDIPEWKLRHAQGYYRIWDCGHLKFSMLNTNFKD